MMLGRREVAVWNLLAVMGLGCASPSTDDAASGEDSGSSSSPITDTSTTPECSDHTDCDGKGGYCAPDGSCRDYCDEGGCEEEDECFDDEDCAPQEHCSAGVCVPTSEPEPCRDISMPSQAIDLQLTEPKLAATSLVFADVAPAAGTELLIARGDAIMLVAGDSTSVAAMHDAEIGAFVAGDVDDDGVLDLVIADADGVSTWLGDGSSFTATEVQQPLASVQSLLVTDVRIEGAVVRRVLALSDGEIWALPIDAGGLLAPAARLFEAGATGITAFAADATAPDPTIYVISDGHLRVTDGTTSPFAGELGQLGFEPSRLELADFTGDDELDVVAHGFDVSSFSIAINVQANPVPEVFGHDLPFDAGPAAAGDFDGDGLADVAATRTVGHGVSLSFGGPALTELGVVDPFTCDLEIATDFGGHELAAGDIDGDGDAELAVADAERVLVVHW